MKEPVLHFVQCLFFKQNNSNFCWIVEWTCVQIVISKLRAQTVMEYDYKHWKAAKALIVVIPLLGNTYSTYSTYIA
jgi:hypothetical protein